MFSAVYNDGRTGYFVIEGHGTSEEDYLAVQVAQEHQRTGELPESILSIKHGDFKPCKWLHSALACFAVIWKHMGSSVGSSPGSAAAVRGWLGKGPIKAPP